eukprot:m.90735 g.90735  ORF g.90735 m.90735 type:complete len:97 (+) comp12924_c0_seq1:1999-2289(+)
MEQTVKPYSLSCSACTCVCLHSCVLCLSQCCVKLDDWLSGELKLAITVTESRPEKKVQRSNHVQTQTSDACTELGRDEWQCVWNVSLSSVIELYHN